MFRTGKRTHNTLSLLSKKYNQETKTQKEPWEYNQNMAGWLYRNRETVQEHSIKQQQRLTFVCGWIVNPLFSSNYNEGKFTARKIVLFYTLVTGIIFL